MPEPQILDPRFCTWCGTDIDNQDDSLYVTVEAGWDDREFKGYFCSQKHASDWMAKPFPEQVNAAVTIQEKIGNIGCALLALSVLFLLLTGAATVLGWAFGWDLF